MPNFIPRPPLFAHGIFAGGSKGVGAFTRGEGRVGERADLHVVGGRAAAEQEGEQGERKPEADFHWKQR